MSKAWFSIEDYQRPKIDLRSFNMETGVNPLLSLVAFGLPFLSAIVFALVTNHAWEDWYITYRSSKNLALGHGLVYDIGAKVHSFTSPIGTLLPAAIKVTLSSVSDELVLWIFRIIQSFILGLTGLLVFRMGREFRLSKWPLGFLLVMFSVDAKTLDFSTNGMETGFFVFFVALATYSLVVPLVKPGLFLGLAWAGLMWTRPDGFIYIIALSLGFFVYAGEGGTTGGRLTIIRTFCIASGIAASLYLPWLVWTWSYYGSFIPHSLTAKAVGVSAWTAAKTLAFPLFGLTRETSLDYTFTPAYFSYGGWPGLMPDVSRVVGWICCFAWVLPVFRPTTRAISLATLVTQVYLSSVPLFGWYVPPVTLLSLIVLALLLEEVLTRFRYGTVTDRHTIAAETGPFRLIAVLISASIVSSLLVTICVGYELRVQQRVIEDENRKQVGLWLHDHASSPLDGVFLEPLGYIGFYSNLRMYGFPGQSSPELVAARYTINCLEWAYKCYGPLVRYLKPEWIVLRPREAGAMEKDDPDLLQRAYTLSKTFNVSSQLASYWFLPGRGWLEIDQQFLIYRRNL